MKKKRIGLLVAFTGCGAEKVDLNDYVKVEFDGYDGYGKANAHMEWSKLEKDIVAIVPDENIITIAANIETEVQGDLDKTESISNGDSVKYKWDVSEDYLKNFKKKYGIKLLCDDKDIKVKGLKDPSKFDVGDMLQIDTNGVAPCGTLYVVVDGYSGFKAEADKKENLNNGDEVTITIKASDASKSLEEVCKENNIPKFNPEYKYKVKGLANYVKTPDEIPESTLEKMKTSGEERVSDVQGEDCNGKYSFSCYMNYEYKCSGIAVCPLESGENKVFLIYTLTYPQTGATTYCRVRFENITDKEIEEDSINGERMYGTTQVGGVYYFGDDSTEVDNLKAGIFGGEAGLFESNPTGTASYKEL